MRATCPWRVVVGTGLVLCGGVLSRRAEAQSQERAVVRVPHANLRESPSTSSRVLLVVTPMDTLQVVERRASWWRTRVRSHDGWIHSTLLVLLEDTSREPAPIVPQGQRAGRDESPNRDSASAKPPAVEAVEGERVDARLAGRPASNHLGAGLRGLTSQDKSRIGVLGGLAFGAYTAGSLHGAVLRSYLRMPISGTAFAGRLDGEIGRSSRSDGEPSNGLKQTLLDMRMLGVLEYGIPVNSMIEVYAIAGLGLSRTHYKLQVTHPQAGTHGIAESEWGLAREIGAGIKVGQHLVFAMHLWTSNGLPNRLLGGVRF